MARKTCRKATKDRTPKQYCVCGRVGFLAQSRHSIAEYGEVDVLHCPRCEGPARWCCCEEPTKEDD